MRSTKQSQLRGKTALVTGATFGIGQHSARALARCGVNLVLTARTHEKLEELRAEFEGYGVRVDIMAADLYDMAQIEALAAFVEGLSIDIFINNAGKSICRPIGHSLDRMGDFSRTMSINYFAPVAIILSLLKANRALRVVNISTMNVLLPPTPYWAAYGASKSAIDHWLQSAHAELGYQLSVGTIYFALVGTRMIEPTAAYRDRSVMSVERAARIVCQVAGSSRTGWRPWWAWMAVGAAKLFRRIYSNAAMRMIDRG